MKRISIIAAWLLVAALTANADVVFWDTFDAPGTTIVQNDLNSTTAGYPSRQSGGTLTSTYTRIAGVTYLNANSAPLVNDPLTMRIWIPSGNGAAAVRAETDFSSALTDVWKASYSGAFAANGAFGVQFTDFAIGDYGQSAGAAGFAVRIINDGTIQIYAGANLQTQVSIGHMRGGTSGLWDVEAEFNEVSDTVTLTYTDDLGTTVLSDISTDFASSSRCLFLQQTVYSGEGSGVADWRIDDLKVETVPEPATLGLFALSAAGILFFRRFRG